jgi:DNA repair protein RadC
MIEHQWSPDCMIEAAVTNPARLGVDRGNARNPVVALAMADHNGLHGIDVLEALLHMAEPTAKCRKTATLAIEAFGSVGAVLAAGVPKLTAQLGIQEQIAYSLRAIHVGTHWVVREPLRERVLIGSTTDLIDYLGPCHKAQTVHILRVLYLDRKNGLISDEEVNRGTVAGVPPCPRPIVKRALEHSASAVIVVHHQPSEDPKPSNADVNFSQQLRHALSVMRIAMHDSVIVGSNGIVSLRNLGHP